ncbi:MAG: hypothetical protein DHS20C10_05760 [marine bacterium B5-7]|nr:MAG: hypothetical protein DHS20C10_05760 [marine bacterium B5-7]
MKIMGPVTEQAVEKIKSLWDTLVADPRNKRRARLLGCYAACASENEKKEPPYWTKAMLVNLILALLLGGVAGGVGFSSAAGAVMGAALGEVLAFTLPWPLATAMCLPVPMLLIYLGAALWDGLCCYQRRDYDYISDDAELRVVVAKPLSADPCSRHARARPYDDDQFGWSLLATDPPQKDTAVITVQSQNEASMSTRTYGAMNT